MQGWLRREHLIWLLLTILVAALSGGWWSSAVLFGSGVLLLRPRAREQADTDSQRAERPTNGQVMETKEPSRAPVFSSALRAALSAVTDGVVVLDDQDRVVAINDAGRELLGLDGAYEASLGLGDQVDWPQMVTAVQRCRSTAAPQSFEAQYGLDAGRRGMDDDVTLGVTVSLHDHGQVVLVLHDLTRIRRLESHRRDFVGNVSHELKTPLTAIRGFVETLVDDPDVPSATRQRFLERINRQVGRLSTLVTDLLTLSRLDEERVGMPANPQDLAAIVADVVRDLTSLAESKGLELTLESGVSQAPIAAEAEALRQVVGNLVENALKYTTEGSVTVRMIVSEKTCHIDVIDTGIGLSPADRSRVFERFYRVDKARSTELGGTGLGLSIVKNTVQTLGGEVGVESRLGSGSRFWVRLPIAQAL